ncbi:hypothetical protein ACU686_32665 [Yinghuangia aomiensis]
MLPLVEERQWHTAAESGCSCPRPRPCWRCSSPGSTATASATRRSSTSTCSANASYACGSLVMLCYFAGFTSIFFVLTLYLQSGLGDSALVAGLAVTPFALGSAASAAVGGHLVALRTLRLVAAGLLIVICGLGVVVSSSATSTPPSPNGPSSARSW